MGLWLLEVYACEGSSISLVSDIGMIRLLLGGPKKGGGYLKNDT